MPYDIEYNASNTSGGPDNIMGDDNNYRQVTGSACKVGRCVCAEYKEIDGEGIGNRAWVELEREQDTPANRQLLKHFTEQSVKWLVDVGEIRDLVVTVGDPDYSTGAALLVEFFDVRSGDTASLGFIAPWGLV